MPRFAFSKIELFVVLFLVGMLILLLLPALQPPRINYHWTKCMTKQKDIALACNLYEGKYRRLPPSCHVKKYTTAEGVTAYNKDGYSFLVDTLPEMEQEALYKKLTVNVPLDAANDVREGNKINLPDEVLAQHLPMYTCPSSMASPRYGDPPRTQAITNYKAVSGTTWRAYEVRSRTDTWPDGLDIYGTGVLRTDSDGVMYPGSRTTLKDVTDGVTHTLLVTESEEPVFARWIVGQECGLYTMRDDTVFHEANRTLPYIHPVKQTGKQTNLNRDYGQSPYPWGEPGFRSARYSVEPPEGTRLGPSANHGDFVIHAFLGGMASKLSKDIDATVYFSLTTRAGAEPEVEIDNQF